MIVLIWPVWGGQPGRDQVPIPQTRQAGLPRGQPGLHLPAPALPGGPGRHGPEGGAASPQGGQ